MKVIESQIEQLVRFPERLSLQQKKGITRAIRNDPILQEIYEWYRVYYAEFDAIKPALNLVLRQFESSRVYEEPYVLAAKSIERSTWTLESMATFALEEEDTILRVLRNNHKNSYELHLISPRIQAMDRVLLQIGDEAPLLVSEPGGQFAPLKYDWLHEISWKKISVRLFLPTHQVFVGNLPFEKEGWHIRRSEEQLIIQHQQLAIKQIMVDWGEDCSFATSQGDVFYAQAKDVPFRLFVFSDDS